MKTFALFFVLFITCSCGIEYDGETRLVVETEIVDSDGNPLEGKIIVINVSDGHNHEDISDGITNSNGRSTLIFPAPKADSTRIELLIVEDGQHQRKSLYNLYKTDFINYKYVNHVVLFRLDQITELHVTLEHNSDFQFNGYRVEGEHPNEYVMLNGQGPDYFYGMQYYTNEFSLLKNQTVLLHYSVTDMDTMITTESTIEIPIADEPVFYTLQY